MNNGTYSNGRPPPTSDINASSSAVARSNLNQLLKEVEASMPAMHHRVDRVDQNLARMDHQFPKGASGNFKFPKVASGNFKFPKDSSGHFKFLKIS